MNKKQAFEYTTRSELYWDRGWRNREVRDPVVTYTPITDQRAIPSFDSFARAPLVKGDHVHALPYWAEKVTSVIPACSGELRLATYMPPGVQPSFGYPEHREGWTLTQRVWHLDGDFGGYLPWEVPAIRTWSDAELTFLKKAADTKALAGAKRASLNLANIIRERRETLEMIKGQVSSIARSAEQLQRQAVNEWRDATGRNRGRTAQKWANRHLEVVFGMLPLMADIEDAVKVFSQEAIVTHIKTRGTHSTEVADKVDESFVLTSFPGCDGAGYWDAPRAYRKGQRVQRLSVRTALRFEITEQWLQGAVDKGFSPVGFAFDAVPLSFVSGWISNFDQWVRTLEPLFGLEFTTGSRSVKRSADANGHVSVFPVQSVDRPLVMPLRIPTGEYALQRVRWDREALSALPDSSLQWQNNLDWFSVTAGISLAVQRYLKPLKRLLKEKQFEYKAPPARPELGAFPYA